MPNFPWPLKLTLFFINLGGPDTSKPLVYNRKKTNWFMNRMDRYSGFRTKNFFGISDAKFRASDGHDVKLKIYKPTDSKEPLPVLVYFHGGGFAYSTYDNRPNFIKAVAAGVNCIVVSVEYRLSPEHPFPCGVNDCYEATRWVAEHAAELGGDANRIAVGGESAGGNLSAAVSMMARDKGGPKIIHQVLLYPVVDMMSDYPSMNVNGKGYMLTRELIEQFGYAYMHREEDRANVYASPISGRHENLPPATVITAEYDPLVDQGKAYADKLKAAGVPVLYKDYENTIHDFTIMLGRWTAQSRHSTQLVIDELKKAFST